jgi:hypothetical protein
MDIVVHHNKCILQNTLFLRLSYQMYLICWFAVNFNMQSVDSWSGFNRSAYNISVVKHIRKTTFGRPKCKWTVQNKNVRIYTGLTWLELGIRNKLCTSQASNFFSSWECLLQIKQTQVFGEDKVTGVYHVKFWSRFCVQFSAFPVGWWICIVANFCVGPHQDIQFNFFLGMFAKLRKVTVSFSVSIRLCGKKICWLPLDGFSWNLIFECFSKSFKIQISFKSVKTNGYFTWRSVYSIISRSVHVRMGNVSDERCRENQNTFYVQ